MNCRLVKSDSSIHSLQSFSWKDSASQVSDWVDNALTEDFTLDLQSADNVKFQNQQIQSDQTMKKKGDLAHVQIENDNFNECLQKEATKPVLNQNAICSAKPRKILSYNPTAIFTPAPQTTMKPTVNQLIKLPKLTLPEFSGNLLEWPEWSSLFPATVNNAGIDNSLKINHLKTLVTGKTKQQLLEWAIQVRCIVLPGNRS